MLVVEFVDIAPAAVELRFAMRAVIGLSLLAACAACEPSPTPDAVRERLHLRDAVLVSLTSSDGNVIVHAQCTDADRTESEHVVDAAAYKRASAAGDVGGYLATVADAIAADCAAATLKAVTAHDGDRDKCEELARQYEAIRKESLVTIGSKRGALKAQARAVMDQQNSLGCTYR